ncbi:MAG: hypothetical protein ACYS8W_01850 [Planctomycetota bacterium]|jgi:hypothetical protein
MKLINTFQLALLLVLTLTLIASPGSDKKDLLYEAAKALGKKRADLKVDRAYRDYYDVKNGTTLHLKLFTELMDDPVEAPAKVRKMVDGVSPEDTDPGKIITAAAKNLGYPLGKVEFKTPESEKSGADRLVTAIQTIYALKKIKFGESPKAFEDAKNLPGDLCDRASEVLEVAAAAVPLLENAFSVVPEEDRAAFLSRGATPLLWRNGPKGWQKALTDINYKALLEAGARISHAVIAAGKAIAKLKPKIKSDFRCETPLGAVIIKGRKSNEHEFGEEDVLLFIDLRGNDTYAGKRIGVNRSAENPVSIVIDAGGNDEYKSGGESSPTQGAGIFGIGILADFGGNDTYEAGMVSQGASAYGVGVLYDGGKSKDRYTCAGLSQGLGFAGIGILIDGGGDDVYSCGTRSQACGYIKGCGIILDVSGNDKYIGRDPINGEEKAPYPSAQTKDHSATMCQGVAYGWRERTLAGGIGILSDLAGDDEYSCGVFGQGISYYLGIGILNDSSGDDEYRGVWYTQGVGCHIGFAMLHDREGKDSYWTKQNVSLGAGHDHGTGIFLDEKGNDNYGISDLAAGAGNDRGFGLFIDLEGNDTYKVLGGRRENMGFAKQGQKDGYTIGIFIDAKGKDKYPRKNQGNNKTWKDKELSIGIDKNSGKLSLWKK